MSEQVETEARAHWDAGRHAEATTVTLEGYGNEVYSFLVARLHSEDRAHEVFSQTCEDLWKSMQNFEWRCSMRTWIYRLARNATVRYTRAPVNRAARRVPLSQITEVAERVRTRTRAYLRTEVKDEFQKLRERLDPEDQELLLLRVDRGLSWVETAEIMTDDAAESPDAAKRAAARLRQRYQKLKRRLREMAVVEGLLEPGE